MPRSLTTMLRGRSGVTFAVLSLAAASFTLPQSLIVPVLPRMQVQYGTDQTTVTWVVTAYLLSASICTPLLGRIGDIIGKNRMLIAALLALAVGSFAAALAPNIVWMIAARVVQGGGGGVIPLSVGIIRDEFRKRMTMAVGVITSLTAVGFGVGIVLAGPIVDTLGYRALFWMPMATSLVAAVTALLFVPESPIRTVSRLPVLPAVLLSGWLVALLIGLSEGNSWGWGSPSVLGLLACAVVVGASWIAVEVRSPVPLIDMQMMRSRGVWTSNVVSGCIGFGVFATFAFLPQLLQTPREAGYGFGASITESGLLMLPSALASFAVGFATSSLIRWFGARAVVTAGMLVCGGALVSVGLFHDQTWQLLAATTVHGLGAGLVFSALAGVVVAVVPPHQTGVASGMNANIRTIGGAIGSAVIAGIVTAYRGTLGYPAESGYEIGFVVLGTVVALAALAAVGIPDIHRHSTGGVLADAAAGELGMIPAIGAVALSDSHDTTELSD